MTGINYTINPILNQGAKQSCSSYAVSGVVNYWLRKAGKAQLVDADKLYSECSPKGEGQVLGVVLQYCKDKGVPLNDGTRVFVKDFLMHLPSWAEAEAALSSGPMVISMRFPCGATIDDQCLPPPHEIHDFYISHSVVLSGYDSVAKKFTFTNSKGTTFGASGTGVFHYMWLNSQCFGLYSFNLAL